jgi:hypothetical protein
MHSTIEESVGDRIRQVPGVAEVIPGLADVVSFEESGLLGVVLQGLHSSNVFEEGAVSIPLAQLQRLMERPKHVTGFSVIMQKSSDKPAIERARKEKSGLHNSTIQCESSAWPTASLSSTGRRPSIVGRAGQSLASEPASSTACRLTG